MRRQGNQGKQDDHEDGRQPSGNPQPIAPQRTSKAETTSPNKDKKADQAPAEQEEVAATTAKRGRKKDKKEDASSKQTEEPKSKGQKNPKGTADTDAAAPKKRLKAADFGITVKKFTTCTVTERRLLVSGHVICSALRRLMNIHPSTKVMPYFSRNSVGIQLKENAQGKKEQAPVCSLIPRI